MAGGKGARLKPYTTLIPKPLVPVGGKFAILEIILQQLSQNGFKHVTISVNHLSQLIISYFGNGQSFGLEIEYSLENEPLGTIGPLSLIKNLPDKFLVMNGDIFCDINYMNFFNEFENSDSDMMICTTKRNSFIDFGVLEINNKGVIQSFIEKPTYNHNVSMGIYGISKKMVNDINGFYGFDNLMINAIQNKKNIKAFNFEGLWLDIGRGEDYDALNEKFDQYYQLLGISQ